MKAELILKKIKALHDAIDCIEKKTRAHIRVLLYLKACTVTVNLIFRDERIVSRQIEGAFPEPENIDVPVEIDAPLFPTLPIEKTDNIKKPIHD